MPKKLSILLIVIIFASILIFANSRGFLSNAVGTTQSVSAPIALFFSQFSGRTSGFFSGVFRLGGLQRENAELKDSVNRLQAEVAQLAENKKENDSLRKLLGFAQSGGYSYEPAEVIVFDPSNIRGMITINKGSKEGLTNGMAVISDGFLVGRISETAEHTAKVQLIIDPTSAIPVTLQSANTNGIAKGEIGFGLSMEKIPQGEQIKEGDTVITSGLGGDIPKGLILGKVEKIEKLENSLFINALVRPFADMGNLFRVIVIKK